MPKIKYLRFLFFLAFISLGVSSYAQSKPKAFSSKSVDVKAKFIGGRQILAQMFNDSMRYPLQATIFCITGTVPVAFVINERGMVESARAKGKTKLGYGCEKEAVRLIQQTSGRWAPAKIANKSVRQHKLISIRFLQTCKDSSLGRQHFIRRPGSHDSIIITPWKMWALGQGEDIDRETPNRHLFRKSTDKTVYKGNQVDSATQLYKGGYGADGYYWAASFVSSCLSKMMRDTSRFGTTRKNTTFMYTSRTVNDSVDANKYEKPFKLTFTYVVELDGTVSVIRPDNLQVDKKLREFFYKRIESSSGKWMPAVKNGELVRCERQLTVLYVKP